MKTIFTDLHLYELILLFLGIFLFLILSAGLVYYIIKKEEIKKLLLFFPIPILMIAYPSVKEVTISSDKIAFSKYQEAYIENPDDTIAKQNLKKFTEKLEDRAHSAEDIIQISKSKLLLGNTKEAVQYANKAIKLEKERVPVTAETQPENTSATTSMKSAKVTTQALQLKKLAQIQEMKRSNVDTAILKDKIRSIKVDDELKATKNVIANRKKSRKLRRQ